MNEIPHTEDDTRGMFELAYETKVIIDMLKEAKDGDVISYEQILEKTGRTSVKAIRSNINTARKALQDDGYLFDTVFNVGLRRMSDEEIATSWEKRRKHIKKTAERSIREIGTVRNPEALSETKKYAHIIGQTIMATIRHTSTPKAVKQVEADVRAKQEQLTIGATLEAFKKV